jgi:hypothetical protein
VCVCVCVCVCVYVVHLISSGRAGRDRFMTKEKAGGGTLLVSSWCGAASSISDVNRWRLIGGGGDLRNTRFVRRVVSLRGSL